MVNLRINEWSKLKFVNPYDAIRKINRILRIAVKSNSPEKIKNLRTNKLKHHREGWIACLFCYGIGKFLGISVYVSLFESSDFDVVSMWCKDDVLYFSPLQIKEIPTSRVNPEENINNVILKLESYDLKDTTVVIYVNLNFRLDINEIKKPQLDASGLWILGASTADLRKWFIAGDLLNNPKIFEFDYPF